MVTVGVMPLWDEKKHSVWMLPEYLTALISAGAVPLILPLTVNLEVLDACLRKCDGLLLTGGHDITPSLYGERTLRVCGEVCALRDEMEAWIIARAIDEHIPFLGICRGLQILNAVLGGTLWQDLPSQHPSEIEHCMKPPYARAVHDVSFVKGTYLAKLFGCERLGVNSYHHQAVKQLSPRLEPLAFSDDGLCEAARLEEVPFGVAVQWHPEYLCATDRNAMRLFSAFISAAATGFRNGRLTQSA